MAKKIKRKDSNYSNQEYNRKHHCQPLKKSIKECYEYLYDNTLDNLIEMNKCIKRYKVIKPTHEEFRNLNRPTTNIEIKLVTKIYHKVSSGPDGFTVEFYQKLKEI